MHSSASQFIARKNVFFNNVGILPTGILTLDEITHFSGAMQVSELNIQSSSLTLLDNQLYSASISMNNSVLITNNLHVESTLQLLDSNLTATDITVDKSFMVQGYSNINGNINCNGTLQVGARVTDQIEIGPISMDTTSVSSILIVYDPIPMSWDDFVPVKKDIYPFTMPFDHVPTVQDNTNGITTITTLFLNGSVPLITLSVGPCPGGCVHGTCNKERHVCECSVFYNGTRCDEKIKMLPPKNANITVENGFFLLTWENDPLQVWAVMYAIFNGDTIVTSLPAGRGNYSYKYNAVPGNYYTFYIVGYNKTYGFGENVTLCAMGVDVPPEQSIVIEKISMSQVSLSAKSSGKMYPPITSYEWYRDNVLVSHEQTINDTGLTNNTKYEYEFYAINDRGKSNKATCTIFTHDYPGQVERLHQSSANWIRIEWDKPVFDGNTNILGYNVYRNGEKVNTNSLEYYDDHAVYATYTLGGEFTYQVSAYNVEGEGEKQSLFVKLQPNNGLIVAIVIGSLGGAL
jgi:hypothetical protein